MPSISWHPAIEKCDPSKMDGKNAKAEEIIGGIYEAGFKGIVDKVK